MNYLNQMDSSQNRLSIFVWTRQLAIQFLTWFWCANWSLFFSDDFLLHGVSTGRLSGGSPNYGWALAEGQGAAPFHAMAWDDQRHLCEDFAKKVYEDYRVWPLANRLNWTFLGVHHLFCPLYTVDSIPSVHGPCFKCHFLGWWSPFHLFTSWYFYI